MMQAAQSSSGQGVGGLFSGMTMGSIVAGIVFASIGSVYMIQGKNTGNMRNMIIGGMLVLYTFFVQDTVYIVGIGIGIMALPWVMDKFSD